MQNKVEMSSALEFEVKETAGIARKREPVTAGIPIPEGAMPRNARLELRDDGSTIPASILPVASWPDGSAKWVSVQTAVDMEAGQVRRLRLKSVGETQPGSSRDEPQAPGKTLTVDGGKIRILQPDGKSLTLSAFLSAQGAGERLSMGTVKATTLWSDRFSSKVRFDGSFSGLKGIFFSLELTHFITTRLARAEFVLHNARKAKHPGGYWDLVDEASLLPADCGLSIEFEAPQAKILARFAPDASEMTAQTNVSVEQYASGGDNWQSRSHVNRDGVVTLERNGYEGRIDQTSVTGLRASPVLTFVGEGERTSVAMERFWEKFPSRIEANGKRCDIYSFSRNLTQQELQPGEKMSRTIWLDFASDSVAPLCWLQAPAMARPTPATVQQSKALEWFSEGKLPDGQTVAFEKMLSGPRNFFAKREAIDEYDWRNFGDVWADHEEPYSQDAKPVISHYNNQYDILQGFIRRYLTDFDARWWELAAPLATHLYDIDMYHTDKDRKGFNGGLFWHTAHYRDAFTCSHRSYSAKMLGDVNKVSGGGVGSNEHNYSTGLLLYYFLTNSSRAKEAVLSLANWVIEMDDGETSLFAPFCGGYTGNASSTASVSFHGPGRGAGNSINTLLDAWQVSADDKFLAKAKQILYRVIHPSDDPNTMGFDNPELRWSYTVFLQSLCKMLFILPKTDLETRTYVVESLLTYGRWMLKFECNYFDKIEKLEFPTETWHAQDLRKGNMLVAIADLATDRAEGEAMRKRGMEIRSKAWTDLDQSETRSFARPQALVLQQAPIIQFLECAEMPCHPVKSIQNWAAPTKELFVPQRQQALAHIKSPKGLIRLATRAWKPSRWRTILLKVR